MTKCRQLHDLICSRNILAMPGAYDALSARLIEQAGFKACQISGFGVAASVLGAPDIGILSMRDQINAVQSIAQAVSIPVMADGDTGFGNAINVFQTVRMLEAAGAAGVNLEDQVFPKRCGHMEGKQVIPMQEMVQKIRAAVKARRDDYFVINARTDAIAVDGIEEAVRRGNAYAEAGATLIFVEAPRTREEIEYVVRNIKAPVSINMVGAAGGKTPQLSLSELEEIGVARVSFPILTVCSAAGAMRKKLQLLMEQGRVADTEDDSMSFKDITDCVDLPFYQRLSREFA